MTFPLMSMELDGTNIVGVDGAPTEAVAGTS